jgi:hypothetical protein
LRKLLTLVVFLVASPAMAVDVTVTITNLTARQEARLASVLSDVNASRTAQGLSTFATFEDYAAWVVVQSTTDYIQKQEEKEAKLAAGAALEHGDETAPAGQCTAASLAAGCRKSQVACFVLIGDADCSGAVPFPQYIPGVTKATVGH